MLKIRILNIDICTSYRNLTGGKGARPSARSTSSDMPGAPRVACHAAPGALSSAPGPPAQPPRPGQAVRWGDRFSPLQPPQEGAGAPGALSTGSVWGGELCARPAVLHGGTTAESVGTGTGRCPGGGSAIETRRREQQPPTGACA